MMVEIIPNRFGNYYKENSHIKQEPLTYIKIKEDDDMDIEEQHSVIKKAGRPIGSKDKKPRKKKNNQPNTSMMENGQEIPKV